MNFIKSNPFVSALAGITLVVCGALYFLASKGGGKYDDSKTSFDESYAAVTTSEGIALYPTAPNRDGKRKALGEYRESIAELRGLFDKYRPKSLANVKPQAFTDRIQNADKETSAAFAAADCTLPEGFFLGFEAYRNQLAREDATGVLGYQLDGIKHALLGLAAARPSELIRIHRQPLPEESGGNFQREPNSVARNFAVEFTFRGSESSARKFISYLGQTDPYYYVIRSMKIANEKDVPPKVSDAKFENDEPAAAPTAASPFDAFILPGGEEEAPVEVPAEGDAAPDGAAAPDAPDAEAPPEKADSSRILAQVLGSEEVIVFVRFDTLMFLPAEELPKP